MQLKSTILNGNKSIKDGTMSEYWKEKNPPKHYTDEDYLLEGKRAIVGRRLSQAIKNGTLRRALMCWTCGKLGKTQGHHYKGYDFPFDVWWLCAKCNVNLRGYHDGSIDLQKARKLIIDKYFNRRMYYFEWYAKQTESCCACGVPDEAGNMALISDTHEEGKFILCQRCCHAMFGEVQEKKTKS